MAFFFERDPFFTPFGFGGNYWYRDPFAEINRLDRDINRLFRRLNRPLLDQQGEQEPRRELLTDQNQESKGEEKSTEGKQEETEEGTLARGGDFWQLQLPSWNPSVDVKEREGEIVIEAELPGVKKEDVNLELHNNTLRISGEKREERKEEKERFHTTEISYGKFERHFPLPKNVKDSDIRASFDNGVLKISFPKPQKQLEGRKKIAIAGGELKEKETKKDDNEVPTAKLPEPKQEEKREEEKSEGTNLEQKTGSEKVEEPAKPEEKREQEEKTEEKKEGTVQEEEKRSEVLEKPNLQAEEASPQPVSTQ